MRTKVFFSATCPQNKLFLRTAYPFSAGSKQGPGSGGTPFRPLPESGGGHVLRSQSLPALPDGRRSLLRQPVGEPCVGLWTFACAVGGRGERAWGRLTRAFGAGRAAGWRRASIFLLARRQPCRLCRKHRTEKGLYFWPVPHFFGGPGRFCRGILARKRYSPGRAGE